MKSCHLGDGRHRGRTTVPLGALAMTIALGIALAAPLMGQDTAAQDKTKRDSNKGIGFMLSGDAKEADLGSPIYPGARQHKDSSDDSPGLTMGLWGGSSG